MLALTLAASALSAAGPTLADEAVERCYGIMNCGGFTPALKIMGMAGAHGRRVELQCWGYTLHQAANLALMLGQPNTTYFEQPMPYETFEFASRRTIRTDADGMVYPPDGAGRGIELDWQEVARATLEHFEVTPHNQP